MDDGGKATDAELARQAAIQSAVSNLVYLAVMIGFTVAVTKRDALTRLVLRWRQLRAGQPVQYGEALHQVRRDIARFEGRDVT